MKKILFLLIVILGSLNIVFAEPIVELAAPRQAPKIIEDGGSVQVNKKTLQTSKTVKKTSKKTRKYVRKKYPKTKVNYDKISKMIEYGYYDDADKILENVISGNPKNIKAKALWVISLAKQSKLAPAQKELNNLLKKYPNNADLYYAQGVVYYQRTSSSNMLYRNKAQKLINDAMAEFKKAISLDKKNAKAYNAAGVISIKSGKAKEAASYFKKALEVDKTYSLAIDNLGTIDLYNGKLDDAEKKFKKSLTYNTQNTTAMYHLAQIAMQKQDYAKALIYLNNALYLNSNSPAIYNLMGKAYLEQRNEAAAINAFKQSIEVKPEFTLSYLDLANIYEKRGDNEFAIEQLKTALNIEPNYYDAKLKLADISLRSEKYREAINVYSELVGIDGYNESALKGLADSYFGQAQVLSNKSLLGSNKDLFKALECINNAISANPKNLELHLAKLKLTKITNQPEQSKIVLNKIVQSPSNDLMSNVIKGEAYIILSDYLNAQKCFDSAIKLSKNTDDDFYLSEIFMYHKQYNSAQKVILKILKNDAQNQDALNSLNYIQKCKKYANDCFKSAKSFMKSRNLTAAKEYLLRSLSIEANNAEAHLLLAKIYEKQKDYQNAVSNYKAYLSLEPGSKYTNKIQNKIEKLDNKL